ncbi:MAG TPA: nitroreductase family protein [Anaerolineaceae bacterium]|nr:nitroreductase family protein [Anaerolineaceae bacterium]
MNDFLDVFFKRRSIRRFTEEPVSREELITLLKAGMSGPSGMNAQPWEFVVVTDEETLAKFRRNLMFAKMKGTAAICVLGSKRMQTNKAGDKFWVQDCSAATENILLAATAMGLGAVWIGIHPVHIFERQVKSILNLPAGVTPFNLIILGHPAEEKEARTQYDTKRVHWGTFPRTGKEKLSEEDSVLSEEEMREHDLHDL